MSPSRSSKLKKICLLMGCGGVVVGGNMFAERAVVVAMSEDKVSPIKDWMRLGSSATLLMSSEAICSVTL